MLSFPLFFDVTRTLHIRRELNFCKDNQKFNLQTVLRRSVFDPPHSMSLKYCPFKVPRHCWKWKFLRILHSFWVFREYAEVFRCTVYGECGKCKLSAVHKIVKDYPERIYAYMEKTLRDTKLRISRLIMVQHELFLDFYCLYKVGFSQKKYLSYSPFKVFIKININAF